VGHRYPSSFAFFCHIYANAACFIATTLLPATQEARLRDYLGEAFVPRFGPPTPAPAFSVASRVAVPHSGSGYLGLGCPAPGPAVDRESSTRICSLCAARLDADVQGCKEYEATPEGLDRDKRNFFSLSVRHCFLISLCLFVMDL